MPDIESNLGSITILSIGVENIW